MKIVYGLLFALIFAVALLFSFKNLQPVNIHLFVGTIHVPLALALLVELLAGVTLGAGVQFFYSLKLKSEQARLLRALTEAEQEIENLRTRTGTGG